MKKLIIISLVMFSGILCHSQEFYVRDSADIIYVNIPKRFKTYTYNHYTVTDTSLIIKTHKDSLDLYVRDQKNNKTMKFVFSESSKTVSERIKGKEYYETRVGEPVTFLITADHDYILLADKEIRFSFVIDETGSLTSMSNTPLSNNFALQHNYTYGFEYTSDQLGYQPIKLRLINDSIIEEIKEIPVTFQQSDIILTASAEVSAEGFDRNVICKVTSSSPVLSDVELEGYILIEINGFKEKLPINAFEIKKNSTEAQCTVIKKIYGRQPRNFSIKKIFLETKRPYHNANYHFNKQS